MSEAMNLEQIYQKLRQDQRISSEEGLFLLRKAPWLEIAQLANEKRARLVGSEVASYTVFPIVNYTNVCTIDCSFCSFKKDVGDKKAYVLDKDSVFAKIAYAQTRGADQIFLQGGVHPGLPVEYYTTLMRDIKSRFDVHIRGFSPVELKHIADQEQVEVSEVIRAFKAAGLDSVPGAGAEILVERVRKILAPKKCTTQEWADIMKECHRQGLFGSANIVFGSVETDEEIFEHLQLIRDIQDETKGFNTFIPWTFQAQTKDFLVKKIAPHLYLKILGLCRLFLDNIQNIEVSVMVLGKDIGKLALHMGANDISSPVIEENVLRSYGVKSEEESQKLITEAGFKPLRRDFNYSTFQEVVS
ncbi:MAG: dehypoxanthine futalosine cyclase [SAR324 cluster bacterium]|uniref:Dehypoxanthine futalosine cyclase n=1 Tax=SAR324 cluster bacterium TaxID=2024889 RepID=A0A2A4TAS0_9DELT|nr:MAG: dehypoxanthine futalosine cyclase [SAR324 cluster bacterium]